MSPRAAIFVGSCLDCKQHGCALQPVTAIHHIAGIDRLAAVCDGNLLLLDPESLEEWHVPGAKVAAELLPCLLEHLQGPGVLCFFLCKGVGSATSASHWHLQHCLQSTALYHPDPGRHLTR